MRRQFLTYHDARKTKKQHTSPCSDCPFARASIPGWLGNMSAEEWMELAHGEGTADCHTTDKQCAGLAIYRANVAKSVRDPGALRLPADRVKVFSWMKEFLDHHKRSRRYKNG